MTSFVLRSVQDRPSSYPARDDNCTFCRIVAEKSGAHVVYEDEDCMAFLDIYPMRPGHTLLIPKTHVVRLADLDPTSAGKMGMALPKVVNAVCEATGNPDLNVVCNQGYAQAVHVHWHLIPAPTFSSIPKPDPKPKASNITSSSDPVGELPVNKLSVSSPSRKKKNNNKSYEHKPAGSSPPSHQYMLRGEMAYRDFLDDDEAEGLVREIKSRL
ncbi:hypothetical protein FFLO_05526 [Filobasidium floriforme]|uniref:HIT domain-containing protein n=1 Tax=Filobasidium floriforme TaxID=5210 RepID=A0A8K0NLD5_9TREE|nr:hypothetical protein FFLO_05526 [Filobasidium floriforme]